MRQEIINYISKKYREKPEFLWKKYPTFCVFRHKSNRKWFAIIMRVPRSVLKLSGDGAVDIINVKTDNIDFAHGVRGILPAYHMNKNNWISVLLDGTLSNQNVQKLIEMSFKLTE